MSEQAPNPDPERWWLHRRRQAYLGIAELVVLAGLAAAVQLNEHQAAILGWCALGALVQIAQYAGATLEDVVRAYRGTGR